MVLFFVVFSLFFLALGVFCVALRDRYKHSPVQESFKEYCKEYFDPPLFADFIIVYITVCIPITWTAYSAYAQTQGITFLISFIVPNFMAGLHLKIHTKR